MVQELRHGPVTLNITIDVINPEFSMSQFFLEEQGDYILDGESASVGASGMLAITSGTKTCANPYNSLFPDVPCRTSNTFTAGDLLVQGQPYRLVSQHIYRPCRQALTGTLTRAW